MKPANIMDAAQKLNTFSHYSDAEIIGRIIKGETGLFEILIRRNNSALYKVGKSYNYTHHDVEDLMQETYISAFLNLSQFQNRSSFKTWLIKIMINQCLAKMQRYSYKKEKVAEGEMNEKTMPAFSGSNPGDTTQTVANKELNHILENSLGRLPLDYRSVFSLREINGLSVAETSEVLDISETNVKVRLNRAKTMLRRELEKLYSPEDLFEFNLVYCDRMVARVMNHINKLCLPS